MRHPVQSQLAPSLETGNETVATLTLSIQQRACCHNFFSSFFGAVFFKCCELLSSEKEKVKIFAPKKHARKSEFAREFEFQPGFHCNQ